MLPAGSRVHSTMLLSMLSRRLSQMPMDVSGLRGMSSAAKRLFVGNLSWTTTRDDLLRAFEPYGTVEEAVIPLDKFSGRSRGFGFVHMPEPDASKAVQALNGSNLMGRQIRVEEAAPREPREARGPRSDYGGSGGRGGGEYGGRGGGDYGARNSRRQNDY